MASATRTPARAEFRPEGSLGLRVRGSGPGVEEAFSQDEIEAWMTIGAEGLPPFLLAGLRLGFASNERMTIAAVRDAAEAVGIETNLDTT